MERPKMELEVNKPTRIKLLFNGCIEGSSQHGKYYLYGIQNGDGKSEFSLFAADELHKQLKQYPKDTELLVTKLAASRGNKIVVTWDVKKIGENVVSKTTNNKHTPQEDFYYTAMETSFDEAIRLQQKFNGVNISQVAISLFIQKTSRNNQSYGRG